MTEYKEKGAYCCDCEKHYPLNKIKNKEGKYYCPKDHCIGG